MNISTAKDGRGSPLRRGAGKRLPVLIDYESGQTMRSSFIHFANEHDDAWSARFTYWMGIMPHLTDDDAFEEPSFFWSYARLNWAVPKDITNPIDRGRGSPHDGFLSVAEVIYAPHADCLWIYYRYTNRIVQRNSFFRGSSCSGASTAPEDVAVCLQRPVERQLASTLVPGRPGTAASPSRVWQRLSA